jgi:hypothetical protein
MNDDRRLPAAPPLATAGPDPVLDLISEAKRIEAEFDGAAAAALKLADTDDPTRAWAHMSAHQLADASISASHRVMGARPRTLAGLGSATAFRGGVFQRRKFLSVRRCRAGRALAGL